MQDSPHYRLLANHIVQLTTDAEALSADPAAAVSGCAGIELIRGLLLSAGSDDSNAAVIPSDILLSRIRAYVRRDLTDPDLGAEHRQGAQHIGPAGVQDLRERGIQPRVVDHQSAVEQVRADLIKFGA
ncbi:hypothetical protein [Nocardia sp. Marseille-Q1738]